MAYVFSHTTVCVRSTTAKRCTCLIVSGYAAGKVDNSVHDNVAPTSTYTKSVHNTCVSWLTNKHKERFSKSRFSKSMTTSGSGSGLLLVTRLNDNHSAVPVVGKLVPISYVTKARPR